MALRLLQEMDALVADRFPLSFRRTRCLARGHFRGERTNRHGIWSGRWGENIAYGKSNARDIIIALIIDDGLRARKHRKNIFNPDFHVAGAAVGPHARYRTVCSIDFAGGYAEGSLLARN